jgi:hypothetical protein
VILPIDLRERVVDRHTSDTDHDEEDAGVTAAAVRCALLMERTP